MTLSELQALCVRHQLRIKGSNHEWELRWHTNTAMASTSVYERNQAWFSSLEELGEFVQAAFGEKR